jgi:hypothetical protein
MAVQSSSRAPRRTEQSSSASASLPATSTGTPVVHLGYPNANAKFTRTTRPRSSAGPSGSELSHSVVPSSEGMCTRASTVT